MLDFWTSLFDSTFMPHGHCYFWRPEILWLHVISDSLIALSYYSIPIALLYFVMRRDELVFDWMFLLFASFIFLCGTTHLMEIWSVWNGTYRLSGLIKAVTAVASIVTAVLLWLLIPKALTIPSPKQLQDEIARRTRSDEELEIIRANLEELIKKRTSELENSNDKLREQSKILRRFNNVTMDRELQMVNLKKEVNELLEELHRPSKYVIPDESGDIFGEV